MNLLEIEYQKRQLQIAVEKERAAEHQQQLKQMASEWITSCITQSTQICLQLKDMGATITPTWNIVPTRTQTGYNIWVDGYKATLYMQCQYNEYKSNIDVASTLEANIQALLSDCPNTNVYEKIFISTNDENNFRIR